MIILLRKEDKMKTRFVNLLAAIVLAAIAVAPLVHLDTWIWTG